MFTLHVPFIILIERRRLARRLVALGTALAMALAGFAPAAAHARWPGGHFDRANKVAADLHSELDETQAPKRRWARKGGAFKMVEVVIVSDSKDPEMRELRAAVEQLGGRVVAVHGAVQAMTVQLKARHVRPLSRRDDVVSISPNRDTVLTKSTWKRSPAR